MYRTLRADEGLVFALGGALKSLSERFFGRSEQLTGTRLSELDAAVFSAARRPSRFPAGAGAARAPEQIV